MDHRQESADGSSRPLVSNGHITFGVFQVDLSTGELRKSGVRIKLHHQPFEILVILLERPGEVVTRDQLQRQLWASDTFVDFEHGLNKAVNKLREALGDDSENPRFIETLHRRGYRFIAAVNGTHPPDFGQNSRQLIPADEPTLAQTTGSSLTILLRVLLPLTVFAAAVLGVYSLWHRPARMPFQKFTMTQITHSGKAARTSISPDGRYVLSVMDDKGLESLWLRNVPTGGETEIIQPSISHYESLAFSPDGNFIYFRKAQDTIHSYYNLFRCPVLGGTPQTVVENVDSDIAFSPDGEHFAYFSWNTPEWGKFRILSASLDGTHEMTLQTAPLGSGWPQAMAWSPNGNAILYSQFLPGRGGSVIDALDIRTGRSHGFATSADEHFRSIRWSPDGRVLFVVYTPPRAYSGRSQIGFLTHNGKDIEPITRDTNRYTNLTLSADGRTMATVLARTYATVSVLRQTKHGFAELQTLLSQTNELNNESGVNWSADGSLLVSNYNHLLRLGADGKSQTQLLDSNAAILTLSSCGANYLLVNSLFPGNTRSQSIWRTNADGSSPVKLTDGEFDWHPVCSPDHKWVYYIDRVAGRISRVLLDGSSKAEAIPGIPEGYYLGGLAVSPDGKTLATIFLGPTRIVLFEPGSSSPPRMIDANAYILEFSGNGAGLYFTPDGKSVLYVGRENGVDNVWVQPVDGSRGYAITDFKSEQIWSFS